MFKIQPTWQWIFLPREDIMHMRVKQGQKNPIFYVGGEYLHYFLLIYNCFEDYNTIGLNYNLYEFKIQPNCHIMHHIIRLEWRFAFLVQTNWIWNLNMLNFSFFLWFECIPSERHKRRDVNLSFWGRINYGLIRIKTHKILLLKFSFSFWIDPNWFRINKNDDASSDQANYISKNRQISFDLHIWMSLNYFNYLVM